MMCLRIVFTAFAAAFPPSVTAEDPIPFVLPVAAEPDVSVPAVGGWASSGTIRVSANLARRQLAVKVFAAGWRFRHSISLEKNRVVESWTRDGDELTLMTWRIATGRTGYSYGVSRLKKQGAKGSARKGGGAVDGF